MGLQGIQQHFQDKNSWYSGADKVVRGLTLIGALVSPHLASGSRLALIAQRTSTARAAIWGAFFVRDLQQFYGEKPLSGSDNAKDATFKGKKGVFSVGDFGKMAGTVTAGLFATLGAGAAIQYFMPSSKVAGFLFNKSSALLPVTTAVWCLTDVADIAGRKVYGKKGLSTADKLTFAACGFELFCQAFGAGWIHVPHAMKASQVMGIGSAIFGGLAMWKS